MIGDTATIIALIQTYGYMVIFPISVIEGPIITVIAGFLVSLGYLNAFVVFLVLLLGDIVGDILYYLLGKWGGLRFVRRWGKYIFLDESHIARLTEYFKTRGWGMLLFSKTHAAGSVILVSAGAARMHFGKFVWISFIGSLPKTLVLQAIGMYGGASFEIVDRYLNRGAAITTAIAVCIAAYWIYRKYMTRESTLP